MVRPKGIYILAQKTPTLSSGPPQKEAIAKLVDVAAPVVTRKQVLADLSLVRDVDFIFSGWGAPVMDGAFLEAAPKLQAVFYASGTVKNFVTDEFWKRGIRLSGANSVFILPVAEYTISQFFSA